ncbi:hypothetical protein BJY52DRAFT_294368 [Lactarius psammicola]|nr:hypothetical protein BJY52DRAFT_294368 [Lactarius psammicola]
MIHLKTPFMSSISTTTSPKFAGLIRKASSTALAGVEVVFGKGRWKPADEFLGYSYGPLSSYRKFYIPDHRHSLRWKRSGVHYACTTETVKGPVAVLEPAMQRAPPQIEVLDPLFDFFLVTALLMPSEEWMNVTRTSPSDSFLDDGNPSDVSPGLSPSNTRPFSGSPSSGTPEHQPSCTCQRPLRRSIDGGRAYQLALRMTTTPTVRRALMAQQARLRPEQ